MAIVDSDRMTAISYMTVLERIKNSQTFKDDKDIQSSVEKVRQIYLNHPMGLSRVSQGQFKERFFTEVNKALKEQYETFYDENDLSKNGWYVTLQAVENFQIRVILQTAIKRTKGQQV